MPAQSFLDWAREAPSGWFVNIVNHNDEDGFPLSRMRGPTPFDAGQGARNIR